MVFSLLSWWYSAGYGWVLNRIEEQLSNIGKTLAVGILLKTWTAPWKQITTSGGYANFMQRTIDNMISRLIGFFVRSFMLLVAFFWAFFVLVKGFVWIVLWSFIPMAIIILPILFFAGVSF